MNLWAIQIMRKSHSKDILRAKIVDVDTMQITELAEDLLIGAIAHGRIHVNNLAIQNNKVVLIGYDKTLKQNKAKMYMQRERRGDNLIESFIIMLRGYKAVYEFIADNPLDQDEAIHLIGTVVDLEETLDGYGVNWGKNGYGLYNGIVTNKTYAHKDDGRYKIIRWVDSIPGGYEEPYNTELKPIVDVREQIECAFCQIDLINGFPIINHIEFSGDDEDAKIPEGIYMVNNCYGGAYMITFPKTLNKLGEKCFELDEDILQINFNGPIKNIPRGFARATNLQIFSYPEKFKLESIDEYAFAECEDLNSDLLSQVEIIRKCAFLNTSIKKVMIPCCKEIGPGAFKDNFRLETVKLGQNVVIKEYAFADCLKLSRINLSGATYIGRGAFKNCKKLKEVEIRRGTTVEADAFHKNTVIKWI